MVINDTLWMDVDSYPPRIGLLLPEDAAPMLASAIQRLHGAQAAHIATEGSRIPVAIDVGGLLAALTHLHHGFRAAASPPGCSGSSFASRSIRRDHRGRRSSIDQQHWDGGDSGASILSAVTPYSAGRCRKRVNGRFHGGRGRGVVAAGPAANVRMDCRWP